MDTPTVEQALSLLGARCSHHTEVELLLVGGAAGMLSGVLPRSRTTADCDVMVYLPPDAMASIERAADEVARTLGLPTGWLNSDVQIRRDTLPDGWQSRKVWIGTWGRVRVFAASRIDLIAMKLLAGRAQDLEDIAAMKPTQADLPLLDAYLASLTAKGTDEHQIAQAHLVLQSLGLNREQPHA